MKGNPKIVAENDRYYVIERGEKSKYYGLLEKGKPLSTVETWRGRSLLLSMVNKANYDLVKPPREYKE